MDHIQNTRNSENTLDQFLKITDESTKKNKAKILVIISCTKKKLDFSAPANRLYQGDVFQIAQKWIQIHNYHELILSAKYGLVKPNDILEPYNKKIQNTKDVLDLREKVLPILRKDLKNYDAIVLILGNSYFDVIEPIIQEFQDLPFYRLRSENGIFDYKRNIRKLLTRQLNVLNQISGPEKNIAEIMKNQINN